MCIHSSQNLFLINHTHTHARMKYTIICFFSYEANAVSVELIFYITSTPQCICATSEAYSSLTLRHKYTDAHTHTHTRKGVYFSGTSCECHFPPFTCATAHEENTEHSPFTCFIRARIHFFILFYISVWFWILPFHIENSSYVRVFKYVL